MTNQGLYFETRGNEVKKVDVELATELFISAVAMKTHHTEKKIRAALNRTNYVVEVRNSVIPCPTKKDKNRTCQGLHKGKQKRIIYVHHKRLSESSFVHELIHFLKFHLEGNADPGHKDSVYFERGCKQKYKKDEDALILCEMNCIEGFVNSIIRGLEDAKKESNR